MSESPISAALTGELIVGPANLRQPNNLTLTATYAAQSEACRSGKIPALVLSGGWGKDADDLILHEADATLSGQWEISVSSSRGTPRVSTSWTFAKRPTRHFELEIKLRSGIEAGDVLTIKIANAVSQTAVGDNAPLTVAAYGDGDQPCAELTLPVKKRRDEPGILAFSCDPSTLLNLPGDPITLSWATHLLKDVELVIGDDSNTLRVDASGDYRLAMPDRDLPITLLGFDGPRPVTRQLTLRSVSTGWHAAPFSAFPGDPGFPHQSRSAPANTAALDQGIELELINLFPAGGDLLYGAFRRPGVQHAPVLLYATRNPLVGWQPVSAGDKTLSLPTAVATSPGLYLAGRIWLFGGSQIDMYTPGNQLYSLALNWRPEQAPLTDLPNWQDHGPAQWPARMGHAVHRFNGRIWSFGGLDEYANPLNEVWSMAEPPDPLPKGWQGEWSREKDAPWKPRCLLQVTEFDNRIWLFGGFSEPSGELSHTDIWTWDQQGNWQPQKLSGSLFSERQRSLGGALVVDHAGHLCLFCKRETANVTDQSRVADFVGFRLDPQLQVWTHLDTDQLGRDAWAGTNTFSLQIVNFRDRMLAARALRGDLDDRVVPPLWLNVNRKRITP